MKIKTHCPLSKLLLKFRSQSKAFMLVNPVVDPGEGPGSLLFHQNEARRAEKIFFGDPPRPHPYLKVWICHCNQPLLCSISVYSLSWQMLLTHRTLHDLFHYPRLPDSTFVAPCQWCAKLVTDYSIDNICEKLCF